MDVTHEFHVGRIPFPLINPFLWCPYERRQLLFPFFSPIMGIFLSPASLLSSSPHPLRVSAFLPGSGSGIPFLAGVPGAFQAGNSALTVSIQQEPALGQC